MIRVRTNREGFQRIRTLAEALHLSPSDMAGPVLKELGVHHRRQENQIFASEGSAAASGRWPALSPGYASRKRKEFGRKKILQRTGDMKSRLTKASNPNYYQDYVARSDRTGIFRFGARSGLARSHISGIGSLPMRDMLTKTAQQVGELRLAFATWYRTKRVPQVLRQFGPAIRNSRPR